MKATKDHIAVKILTFKADNIADIVKCFFEEQYETDNPGYDTDDTLEEFITNSSTSSDDSKPSIIGMITRFLTSTLQTFTKRDVTPTNTLTSFNDDEEAEGEGTAEDAEEDKEEDKEEDGKGEERKDNAN